MLVWKRSLPFPASRTLVWIAAQLAPTSLKGESVRAIVSLAQLPAPVFIFVCKVNKLKTMDNMCPALGSFTRHIAPHHWPGQRHEIGPWFVGAAAVVADSRNYRRQVGAHYHQEPGHGHSSVAEAKQPQRLQGTLTLPSRGTIGCSLWEEQEQWRFMRCLQPIALLKIPGAESQGSF